MKRAKKKVTKKPAAKRPAAKKSVAKKRAAKRPVGKTAAKAPAAKKPAAKKPAAKKPSVKKPAAKKPVAKKPVAKKPVAKKPVAKKPVAKKPVAKAPVAKPVAKAPVAKPAAKVPVAKPAAKEPVAKPVVKQPVAKQPVAKQTAKVPVAKPPAKEPVAKEPAKESVKAATKKSGSKKSGTKEPPAPTYELTDADFERMWQMIDRVRRKAAGNLTASIAAFRRELEALDDEGVLRVGGAFNRTMARAYQNLLWGGAYVLHGGCSDDTFWDFRAGLVALGRDVYEAALANPDTLADIEDVENLTLFEGFQYVPSEVAEARGLALTERQHLSKVAGDGFSDSDLPKLFPKLTARFG